MSKRAISVFDRTRPLAQAASAAAVIYVVTLVAVPFVDRSVDVMRAHPEDYTTGPARALVLAGYWAVAVMALAAAALLASGTWRDRVAAALLAAGAITSVAVAIDPVAITGGVIFVGVLGLAAGPPVVAVWGPRAPVALRAVGLAVPVCFLGLVIAPTGVDGIANRLFDVVLGAWGTAFGLASLAPRASHRASSREG